VSGRSAPPTAVPIDFASIFEKARFPVYALNGKRHLVFANGAFWEFTGLSWEEVADLRFEPGTVLEIDGGCIYGLGPPPELDRQKATVRTPWPATPDRCPLLPLDVLYHPLLGSGERLLLVLCVACVRTDEGDKATARLQREILARLLPWRSGDVKFVALSPVGRQVLDRLELAALAPLDRPVLITGERGSGRSLAARFVHVSSGARGAFISVDLSLHAPDELSGLLALPTGDVTRTEPSIWDLAAGGTVVLEGAERLGRAELGALRQLMQRRRCRVVLVTLDRPDDLRRRYGEELACWLATVHVGMPNLRERRGDIIPLALWFVNEYRRHHKRGPSALAADACERLLSYDWPGNVAQLREVIEAACARTDRPEIHDEDLPGNIKGRVGEPYPVQPPPLLRVNLEQLLQETERRLIQLALALNQNNKAAAAEALGLSRAALYRRMVQLGLELEPKSGSGG